MSEDYGVTKGRRSRMFRQTRDKDNRYENLTKVKVRIDKTETVSKRNGIIRIVSDLKHPIRGLYVPAKITEDGLTAYFREARMRVPLTEMQRMMLDPMTVPDLRAKYHIFTTNTFDQEYFIRKDGRLVRTNGHYRTITGPPLDTQKAIEGTLERLVKDASIAPFEFEKVETKPSTKYPKEFRKMLLEGEGLYRCELEYLWDGKEVRPKIPNYSK